MIPMRHRIYVLALCAALAAGAQAAEPEVVRFPGKAGTLGGELYRPSGEGPFPVLLYNHGSAAGMLNSQAAKIIGPLFAARGWIFFMPYRRGQGLSADAGPYIGDEIKAASARGGMQEASRTMTRLLGTGHLDDQLSALAWIQSQPYAHGKPVAVAGNSFGGVEAVLGAAKAPYCAAVVASGGAESWSQSPELQEAMKSAARSAASPMMFFQAANDFNLEPSQMLSAERAQAGKITVVKTYDAFGKSAADGHSFAYRGAATWFPDVFSFIDQHCR